MSQQVSIDGDAYNVSQVGGHGLYNGDLVTLDGRQGTFQNGEIRMGETPTAMDIAIREANAEAIAFQRGLLASISNVRVTTGPGPGDYSMEGGVMTAPAGQLNGSNTATQEVRNAQSGLVDSSDAHAAFITRMNRRTPALGDYVPSLPVGAAVQLEDGRVAVVNGGYVLVLPVDRTPRTAVIAGGGGIGIATGGGGGGIARTDLGTATITTGMVGRITDPGMDEIRAELVALRREVNELKAEKAALAKAEATRNQPERRRITV